MQNQNRKYQSVSAVLGLVAAAGLASAQPTVTTVLRDFDFVGGFGSVTTMASMAINNNGDWLIEVDTDFPDTNLDGALIRNDLSSRLREGDALLSPVGASLGSFDAVTLNNVGNSGWNFFLDGLTTSTDSGIYYNDILLIQEGSNTTAPQFSAGTPFIGFFDSKINDSDNQLVMASLDDPAISSTVDRGLIVLTYQPLTGTFTENAIAIEGQTIPGTTDPLADMSTGVHNTAWNNLGQAMFSIDTTGATTSDTAIVLWENGNYSIIGQEGSASIVAGRNYLSMTSRSMDLNNGGDFVFRAALDGDSADNDMIVKNDEDFMREGRSFAAIAPYAITSFGTGPVFIDDAGNVFWYGVWNDPNTDINKGFFRNEELLIQANVTSVDGNLVTLIRGIESGYEISDSGQYALLRAQFNGTEDVVLLLDFGGGDGCAPCAADFDQSGGVDGDDITAFFNDWQAGAPCGDVDGSGGVDGDDIPFFFERWQAGGCN